jgi:hypothetical protein
MERSAAYKKWFYLFCVYVVLEGAFRKWILPSQSVALFLLKDVLLIVAFLATAANRDQAGIQIRRVAPIYQAYVFAWILFIIVRFFVDGFTFETLVGVRYYFAALPLVVLIPRIFVHFEQLEWFLEKAVLLAIPVMALAVVQYFSPIDSAINSYAWQASDEIGAGFGVESFDIGGNVVQDRARVTSTFSYISPYAAYLQFIMFAAIALLSLPRSKKSRWLCGFAAGLCLLNMFMNGSRATVVTTGILAVPILFLAVKRGSISLSGTVTAVTVIAVGITYFGTLDLFVARLEGATDAESRIVGALLMPFNTLQDASFVGAGVGSSFAGMGEYLGTGQIDDANFNEIIHDRVGIELGTIGYIFVLLLKVGGAVSVLHLALGSRNPSVQTWGLASAGYQISWVWVIPFYNSVGALLFFFFVSLYPMLRAHALGAVPRPARIGGPFPEMRQSQSTAALGR